MCLGGSKQALVSALAVAGVTALVAVSVTAAELSVHSVVENPAQYDGQEVTLRGIAVAVKDTISHRGNEYTVFRLQDPRDGTVGSFAWGHAALRRSG
jgi:hypothetical protein